MVKSVEKSDLQFKTDVMTSIPPTIFTQKNNFIFLSKIFYMLEQKAKGY